MTPDNPFAAVRAEHARDLAIAFATAHEPSDVHASCRALDKAAGRSGGTLGGYLHGSILQDPDLQWLPYWREQAHAFLEHVASVER